MPKKKEKEVEDPIVLFSIKGHLIVPKYRVPAVPHKDELIDYDKQLYCVKQVIYHMNSGSEPYIEVILV